MICTDVLCVFYCAEGDPAAVYSAVRTEDIIYGEIIISDKKNISKIRGTTGFLCLLVHFYTQQLMLCFNLNANIKISNDTLIF